MANLQMGQETINNSMMEEFCKLSKYLKVYVKIKIKLIKLNRKRAEYSYIVTECESFEQELQIMKAKGELKGTHKWRIDRAKVGIVYYWEPGK